MKISRRHFLSLLVCAPCITTAHAASLLNLFAKEKTMLSISPEELELIRDPLSRPAWFAANHLPQDQPLVIRDRVFDSTRRLLRDSDIKQVRFIGCVFAGFQGYGNNLENVTFEQCRFLGGEFTGDLWQQVRLVRCEAEGPFKLGCADGEIMFEDCTLEGMTKKQGGYGSWSDHFGIATGQDGGACFIRCHLSNVIVRGAKSLKLRNPPKLDRESI